MLAGTRLGPRPKWPAPASLPAGATAEALAFTWLGNTSSTANAGTYTFADQAMGTAHADRVIIVMVASELPPATDLDITGVTLAGVAMTKAIQSRDASRGNTRQAVGVWYGRLAEGTTASIVVTTSPNAGNCAIGWGAATGLLDDLVPYWTYANEVAAGTLITTKLPFPSDFDGLVVATSLAGLVTDIGFTGVTEAATETVEATIQTSFGWRKDYVDADNVPLAFTTTAASSTRFGTAAVVWRGRQYKDRWFDPFVAAHFPNPFLHESSHVDGDVEMKGMSTPYPAFSTVGGVTFKLYPHPNGGGTSMSVSITDPANSIDKEFGRGGFGRGVTNSSLRNENHSGEWNPTAAGFSRYGGSVATLYTGANGDIVVEKARECLFQNEKSEKDKPSSDFTFYETEAPDLYDNTAPTVDDPYADNGAGCNNVWFGVEQADMATARAYREAAGLTSQRMETACEIDYGYRYRDFGYIAGIPCIQIKTYYALARPPLQMQMFRQDARYFARQISAIRRDVADHHDCANFTINSAFRTLDQIGWRYKGFFTDEVDGSNNVIINKISDQTGSDDRTKNMYRSHEDLVDPYLQRLRWSTRVRDMCPDPRDDTTDPDYAQWSNNGTGGAGSEWMMGLVLGDPAFDGIPDQPLKGFNDPYAVCVYRPRSIEALKPVVGFQHSLTDPKPAGSLIRYEDNRMISRASYCYFDGPELADAGATVTLMVNPHNLSGLFYPRYNANETRYPGVVEVARAQWMIMTGTPNQCHAAVKRIAALMAANPYL